MWGREEGGENRDRRDNTPSQLLIEAANKKANAVKLPCAKSHSNASKVDALLAKQCFTQYLVVGREERRKKSKRKRKKRKRKEKPTVLFKVSAILKSE